MLLLRVFEILWSRCRCDANVSVKEVEMQGKNNIEDGVASSAPHQL